MNNTDVGYFLNLKNALVMVWQAKNPLNANRKVMKALLAISTSGCLSDILPLQLFMGIDPEYSISVRTNDTGKCLG